MSKYTIQWCDIKKEGEKNGKPWKITRMHLRDEKGNLIEDVDTFDEVLNGSTIEGDVVDGQYGKNFKKAPTPKQTAASNFKAQQVEKTMARKEESIAKAQDNKEWGIKTSSTIRMAVDLAIAEGNPSSGNILKWREWLWNNWDVEDKQFPPF